LSIEEQFYLLYPIFLFSIYRYARKYLIKIIILSIFISISFYSEAIFSFFN
jgi:peptidoglycan/LPS O-acetylase OafA/YrhL